MDAKKKELGDALDLILQHVLVEHGEGGEDCEVCKAITILRDFCAAPQPPSDTIAVPRSEWDELQRYKCMWASGLTIKSTGLRGQESGAKPIGYAREDLQDIFQSGYGFSNISNARSNLYCRGVYLAPPSAPAIETAAYMRAAKVCDTAAKQSEESANECRKRNDTFATLAAQAGALQAKKLRDHFLALTPQDGQTALEEFGMKVAEQVAKNSQDGSLWDSELRTIVTTLIGVPPGEGREE